jgi:flagellar biosynthetic protein FlhB
LFLAPSAVKGLVEMLRAGLERHRVQVLDVEALPAALADGLSGALLILAPFLVLMLLAALLGPLAVGGWNLSPQALAFQWERLDPLKGLKRVFSSHGLVELVKALGKFALIAATAVMLLWSKLAEFLGLGDESTQLALGHAAHMIAWGFLILTLPMVLLALLDVPLQLWQHARQLRMTRQEVRDEIKDTEGKPEVKGRIRRMQQEFARRRMMAEVPRADVIVTNPSHYAVALLYKAGKTRAPIVLAKGMDWLAMQIRATGISHGVPLIEAPVLARALYFHAELNREIPAGLYLAVAQVLAYIYQLQRRGSENPITMPDLPVPEELRRD